MKFWCSFCGKSIHIEEYDYAMWCKGNPIYCRECQEEIDNNINQTKRIP